MVSQLFHFMSQLLDLMATTVTQLRSDRAARRSKSEAFYSHYYLKDLRGGKKHDVRHGPRQTSRNASAVTRAVARDPPLVTS